MPTIYLRDAKTDKIQNEIKFDSNKEDSIRYHLSKIIPEIHKGQYISIGNRKVEYVICGADKHYRVCAFYLDEDKKTFHDVIAYMRENYCPPTELNNIFALDLKSLMYNTKPTDNMLPRAVLSPRFHSLSKKMNFIVKNLNREVISYNYILIEPEVKDERITVDKIYDSLLGRYYDFDKVERDGSEIIIANNGREYMLEVHSVESISYEPALKKGRVYTRLTFEDIFGE